MAAIKFKNSIYFFKQKYAILLKEKVGIIGKENHMFKILLGIQIISVISTFAGLTVLLREKPSEEQKLMLSTTVCVYLQCLGYLLEMLSTSFGEARAAICMEYAGGAFMNIFYALFMFQYCKVAIPRWVRSIFFAHSSFVLLNVLTAPYNKFYYSSMEFVETGLFPHMELGHGPLYLINIAVIMISLLSTLAIAIYTYFKKREESSRKKIGILIVSSMVPVLAYILGMAKDLFSYYDPVSSSSAIACVIIMIAVLKQGLFDVVGSAHEHILAALEDAFIVVDENYNLLEANESAKKLFPVLNNAKITFRAPRQIRELFKEQNGEELKINEKYYNFHVQKVYNQETLIGYSGIWFDITESKEHYNEMKELKLQADNANKEKSNFLAKMSHEIRTPMNAIIGYAELILQEEIEPKVENYALDIKSASNNLLSIINAILDISKIESGKLEIVDSEYYIQSLLYDIMSVILISIKKKKLKFISDIDMNLPTELYGDSLRIRQVMINLLNNAVKFTEEGSITLSLHREAVYGDEVYLVWKVTDTGKGIRKEDIKKIFGQFEQVDKKSNYAIEGTGLGLSISKSLVEAMRGTIEVQSEYGKGTTFIIHMKQRIINKKPIESISIDNLLKTERVKEKIAFIAPMAKILVVDDNPVNLDVLKGYLRHYKIIPDLAQSGKEAVRMVQKTEYDIVFMDQMMPEMDGVETTNVIRKLGFSKDKLSIIALTANAISGTKEYLLEHGFNDYASKPIGIKTLEELLLKELPPSYIEYQTIDTERRERVRKGTLKEEKQKELHIEGIDMQKGIRLCGGNLESYKAILKAVSQYGNEKIQLMKQCLKIKDYERYTIEAHALKSNAASIGAESVFELARAQEMAGREGRLEEIDKNGMEMLSEYEKMLSHIRAFLEEEEKSQVSKEKIFVDDGRR